MKPVLLLDNYDSFTFNLAHLLEQLQCRHEVLRNDKVDLDRVGRDYSAVLLSPGPGIPLEAGLMPDLVRRYSSQLPILGICLGHQCIGEIFGANLENMQVPMHGKTSKAAIDDPLDYLFDSIPQTIDVGRYHSWLVSRDNFPECLRITAADEHGRIMALSHTQLDIKGLQFHPESVMTPDGPKIIHNWVKHVRGRYA
ncbi:MAG: aminodeoxychorismate/anthranilate synthase component II [Deltaproteobacteria bacterium]|nr:aminodeoxychorismate/anthranilate synthase component II [Deltaproteobacteria bacterium]